MRWRYIFGCVLMLFLSLISQSVNAEELTVKEQQTVSELEKNVQGLTSWKCTGVTTILASQHYRDEIYAAMKKSFAKYGQDTNQHIAHGFDAPKVFFAATKGNRMLYAEKYLTISPETYMPPNSDIKTLNDFTLTGMSQIHNSGQNYTVEGETRFRGLKKLTSNYILPVNATGFYVPSTNVTPREAILKHGFRFVREDTDEKFGKILVFSGEYVTPQVSYPITFHLAPEFGYRIVYARVVKKLAKAQVISTIKSLIKVQGHWLPAEREDRRLSDDPTLTEPELITVHKFTNHSVNDVTDDMLEVKLAPGDYETDAKTKATYKVGANGERIFQDTDGTNSPKAMWPGWLFTASVTSLLVLTIVAYVRWKRQQLSKSA